MNLAANLVSIAAFTDNYIWMLHDGEQALVVDPGDAGPVLEVLAQLSLRLAGILVTHHHGDHVGGIQGLRPHLHGPIFGPCREKIPEPYTPVEHGETVELLGLKFRVIDVGGHTAGHIAYYAQPVDQDPIVFCGDTLFSGGCGRLFEGTPQQMHDSLARLTALPGHTRVCCAHEYTLSNLRFAQTIEPANTDLQRYKAWCEAQRAADQATLPSTLELELKINPFLRCDEPAVQAAARSYNPSLAADAGSVAVFANLRQWKNEFR